MRPLIYAAPRLLRITWGYLLASLAAGYTLALVPLMGWLIVEALNGRLAVPVLLNAVEYIVLVGLVASSVSGMLAALPAVFIIPLAEARRLRSAAFYGAAGAGAGAASAGIVFLMSTRSTATSAAEAILALILFLIYFAVGGVIGGLVYWRIAGRTAGAWRAPSVADGRAPT